MFTTQYFPKAETTEVSILYYVSDYICKKSEYDKWCFVGYLYHLKVNQLKLCYLGEILYGSRHNVTLSSLFILWTNLYMSNRPNITSLKLPSLFTAWPFWTFQNKSHNMKALVILSHSWSPFLPLTCLYGKHEFLWVSVQPSVVFSWEETPPRLPMQITWPWHPVICFSHGLITVREKKMWT